MKKLSLKKTVVLLHAEKNCIQSCTNVTQFIEMLLKLLI